MPDTNVNGNNERRIRDMLGLVKFCLESTSQEDASGQTSVSVETTDPERRAWLQQAIQSMTIDTTKQLLENLSTVKETIVQMMRDPTQDIPVQKTCDALAVMTDLCEDIDYADDFAKLDGFSIFKPLIGCPHEELTVKACELIAALAQNNPLCQNMAVQTRLLEKLIDFVHIKEDQSHIKARSYALYAISSIIRSNPEVRHHFEAQLDGLAVLLHLLDHQPLDSMLDKVDVAKGNTKTSVYWWRKLRIRSVFLFRTLCNESERAINYFYEKEAIKHLSSQLSQSQDPEIREHLLHALKAYLQSMDADKQAKSLRLVPSLRGTIEQIDRSSTQLSGDDNYDMTDTRAACIDLMYLIKSIHV